MERRVAILDIAAAHVRPVLNLLPPSIALAGNSLPCSIGHLRLMLDVTASDQKGGSWIYQLIESPAGTTLRIGPRSSVKPLLFIAPAPGPSAGPLPMIAAPRDGTLVMLLVDYTDDDAEHPLQDATQAWTVGHNNFDNDGENVWLMAGWCWDQDHYTAGQGRPIGWAPFEPPTAQPPAGEA